MRFQMIAASLLALEALSVSLNTSQDNNGSLGPMNGGQFNLPQIDNILAQAQKTPVA